MRSDTGQHRFYAGVDLHARTMYTHVFDANGKIVSVRRHGEVSEALSLGESRRCPGRGRGPDLGERFGAVRLRPTDTGA